jgi:hypothetical protein
MFQREKNIALSEDIEGNVGGVTAFGREEDMTRFWFNAGKLDQVARRDPFPNVIEFAPTSDAVHVRVNSHARKF